MEPLEAIIGAIILFLLVCALGAWGIWAYESCSVGMVECKWMLVKTVAGVVAAAFVLVAGAAI